MNILAIITPDQFQTVATAWIGAGAAVVAVTITALVLILPKIAELKKAIDDVVKQQSAQAEQLLKIKNQSGQ